MGLQLQQLQDEVPGSELLLPPSPGSASSCHCGGRKGETVFRLRFWLGLSFHCIWIWIWLWLGLSNYIIWVWLRFRMVLSTHDRIWLRIWFFPPSALLMLPTNLQWIWTLLPTNLQWIWIILPTNLQWIWLFPTNLQWLWLFPTNLQWIWLFPTNLQWIWLLLSICQECGGQG